MESLIKEYMEKKFRCQKVLLYNILNGYYCQSLHGKFGNCERTL